MAVSWLGKIGGKDADSLEVSSGFDAEKNCNCSDWNKSTDCLGGKEA